MNKNEAFGNFVPGSPEYENECLVRGLERELALFRTASVVLVAIVGLLSLSLAFSLRLCG